MFVRVIGAWTVFDIPGVLTSAFGATEGNELLGAAETPADTGTKADSTNSRVTIKSIGDPRRRVGFICTTSTANS